MNEEEFEELFGNIPFENIKRIQEYINKNYISVQKVKDKIEELKKNLQTVEHYETVGAINVLQELLEGRK